VKGHKISDPEKIRDIVSELAEQVSEIKDYPEKSRTTKMNTLALSLFAEVKVDTTVHCYDALLLTSYVTFNSDFRL